MTSDHYSLPPVVVLFRELAHRKFRLVVRYPVDALGQLATTFLFFLLIVFGGKTFAGPTFGSNLDLIIVGYFLWSMTLVAFTSLSSSFMSEAIRGTLEQLYVSPFGFSTVAAVLLLVNLVEAFLWGGIVLVFALLVTGETIFVNLPTVVFLTVFTILPVVGLGFALSGLAILYKRLRSTFTLVNYFFLGLIALPAGQYPLLKLVPVTDGSYYLRQAMLENRRLWEFAPTDIGLLVAKSVPLLLCGVYVFQLAVGEARERGVLDQF